MEKLKEIENLLNEKLEIIKKYITEIEERGRIRGKTYRYIRVAAKELRDISQDLRKEILEKFKNQSKK